MGKHFFKNDSHNVQRFENCGRLKKTRKMNQFLRREE
jgi:hypothetical protein